MNQVSGSRAGQLGQVAQLTTWFGRIEAAHEAAEVVRLAREYLASCDEEELAILQEEHCRPDRINNADYVAELAYRLATQRTIFAGSGAATHSLDRMTDFFIQAAARISMLEHMSSVPPGTAKANFQNTH